VRGKGMSALRIGVTPSRKDDNISYHYVTERMMQAVQAAGGEVVMLDYPMNEEILAPQLEGIDGLILAGGPDMHPKYFGQELDPHCGEIIEERDILELYLMDWAVKNDVPTLGVCRGMQVMNIALGGDIFQDIVYSQGLIHRQSSDMRYFHDVTIMDGSILRSLIPSERYPVNSYHHQAVDRVADSMIVSAVAPDGIIEAIERPASRFMLGVQWHPEISYFKDVFSRRIFEAFMNACREE
jgi:putative glutamine amidotransferase